jgi:aminoglycoside phosphotransferase (APT) family kinase protein
MEPLPALAFVFDWLEDRLPAPCQAVLVHGDLRLGNFLHDGEAVTLLLDWELAHFGDPVEDLAWMYRRLWSPQAFLPLASALRLYAEGGGGRIEPDRLLWYRVFSEARHAVISLTAVRRFMDGETGNLRHAGRVSMVNECLLAAFRFTGEAARP